MKRRVGHFFITAKCDKFPHMQKQPPEVFYKKAVLNPLSTNPAKWSNTLKKFVGKLRTNCLSVFDHFVKLALKGLKISQYSRENTCAGVPFL